jgi:hypothetical protein
MMVNCFGERLVPAVNRGKRKEDNGDVECLKRKGRVHPASPAPERGLHADSCVSPHEEAARMAGGKQLGGKQEVAPCCETDFEIFMKLPLTLFFKLLKNFLKNLKLCKNKSCSTFQIPQLSQ